MTGLMEYDHCEGENIENYNMIYHEIHYFNTI